MYFNYIQKTTGLAGLPVHPNPRESLISLYKDTLQQLESIPDTALYRYFTFYSYNLQCNTLHCHRKSVESLTKHRLEVVQSTESVPEIECKLNAGQIEEVVLQAQDELSLLEEMKVHKPWEPLAVKPPANQWKYFDK